MNYNEDIDIDINNLHKEWVKQPVLYMKYAEKAAELEESKQKVKNQLEVREAELDANIREEKKLAGEKVTEKIISSQILIDENYQNAVKRLREATYQCSIVSSIIKGMEHRKKALENLVQLWSGSYFSTPKDTNNFRDKISEDVVYTQRMKLNKDKEI